MTYRNTILFVHLTNITLNIEITFHSVMLLFSETNKLKKQTKLLLGHRNPVQMDFIGKLNGSNNQQTISTALLQDMPICGTPTDIPEAVCIRTARGMCQPATRHSFVQSLADVLPFGWMLNLIKHCAAAVHPSGLSSVKLTAVHV